MPQGLQVWNSAGVLIVDYTDRLGSIVAIATLVSGVDGSITNSKFAMGDPFWMLTPLVSYATYLPTVSFNAGTSTLSWAWEGRSGASTRLIAGVY